MNLVMQIVTNDANSLPQVLQAAGSMPSLLCQEAMGAPRRWGNEAQTSVGGSDVFEVVEQFILNYNLLNNFFVCLLPS